MSEQLIAAAKRALIELERTLDVVGEKDIEPIEECIQDLAVAIAQEEDVDL